MAGKQRQFDVFVLRYIPNVLDEGFVNIGVLVTELDHAGSSDCRFLSDFERVRSFDPYADVDMLRSLAQEIEAGWKQPLERAALIRRMLTEYSGAIQLSLTGTIVTDDPAHELERLASTLP